MISVTYIAFIIFACAASSESIQILLKPYIDSYKDYVLKTNNKPIEINFQFLAPETEALLASEDFFLDNWKENQTKLRLLGIENNVEALKNPDPTKIVLIDIGGSLTSLYHVNSDKGLSILDTLECFRSVTSKDQCPGTTKSQVKPKSLNLKLSNKNIISNYYNYGTDSIYRNKLQDILKEVQLLGKTAIFVGAVGFAKKPAEDQPRTLVNLSEGRELLDLNVGKTYEQISNNEKTASELQKNIQQMKINNAFLYLSPSRKEDKLSASWPKRIAKSMPDLSDKIWFLVNYGGKSFSVKVVFGDKFDDSQNLVESFFGKGKDNWNQYPAYSTYLYWGGPMSASWYPTDLKNNYEKIFGSIEKYINQNLENNEQLRNQESYPVVIRQTGFLRDEYFKEIAEKLKSIPVGEIKENLSREQASTGSSQKIQTMMDVPKNQARVLVTGFSGDGANWLLGSVQASNILGMFLGDLVVIHPDKLPKTIPSIGSQILIEPFGRLRKAPSFRDRYLVVPTSK